MLCIVLVFSNPENLINNIKFSKCLLILTKALYHTLHPNHDHPYNGWFALAL